VENVRDCARRQECKRFIACFERGIVRRSFLKERDLIGSGSGGGSGSGSGGGSGSGSGSGSGNA